MMKLGIIANFPSPEQLAYVKSLGLSFVEMCNNYDHESQRFNDTFHIMKQSVADAGLFIGSIGRWNAEMNKGGKVNEEEYKLIESNLDKAISGALSGLVPASMTKLSGLIKDQDGDGDVDINDILITLKGGAGKGLLGAAAGILGSFLKK